MSKNHTPEHRAYLAKRMRERNKARAGEPLSPDHRAKLSVVHTGKPLSAKHRAAISAALTGEGNPQWRGGTTEYQSVHDRVRRALAGLPCALADDTCRGPLHSALIHGRGTKQEMRGGKPRWYSTRVEDYVPLCDSHHVRYDQYGSVSLEAA